MPEVGRQVAEFQHGRPNDGVRDGHGDVGHVVANSWSTGNEAGDTQPHRQAHALMDVQTRQTPAGFGSACAGHASDESTSKSTSCYNIRQHLTSIVGSRLSLVKQRLPSGKVSIPRFENGMRCWNVDDEPFERWKRRGAGGRVAAEKAVEPEKDKNEVEVEQGWTRVVRKGKKGLCTSAGVL